MIRVFEELGCVFVGLGHLLGRAAVRVRHWGTGGLLAIALMVAIVLGLALLPLLALWWVGRNRAGRPVDFGGDGWLLDFGVVGLRAWALALGLGAMVAWWWVWDTGQPMRVLDTPVVRPVWSRVGGR